MPRNTWIPLSVRPRSLPYVVSAIGAAAWEWASAMIEGAEPTAQAPAARIEFCFKNVRRDGMPAPFSTRITVFGLRHLSRLVIARLKCVVVVRILPSEVAAGWNIDGDICLDGKHGPDRPQEFPQERAITVDPHSRAHFPVHDRDLVVLAAVIESPH